MVLPEYDTAALVAQIHEMREQFADKLRAQAVHLQRLEESLEQIRGEQRRLEGEFWEQFEALGKPEPHSLSAPLEAVLDAARNLLTATSPKQLFTVLTEEMHRLGVRAVAFEVRGEAAWAASARGFGPQ